MFVHGRDCSLAVKIAYRAIDVPYSEETIRGAVALLYEEPSIEGDGVCRAIRKSGGAIGCVVTPLTIGTTPLLLCLSMGEVSSPVFVSGTRNLHQYRLDLIPPEGTEQFGLIQDRGGERRYYPDCRVKGFELRIEREKALKLKLEISGEKPPVDYLIIDTFSRERGERFKGDNVTYTLNGIEYQHIYGVTLNVKKNNGTKTELSIRRALRHDEDIPELIEEMTITARLLRDKYEDSHAGVFRITLNRLVLVSDETSVECDDTVIGPVRYFVTGKVGADVFTSGEELIA